MVQTTGWSGSGHPHLGRHDRKGAEQTRGAVAEVVAQTREVVENVTTLQPVQRTGTRCRIVEECVQETVQTTETYCEMVPYTTIIKVPAPCCDH